MRRHLPVLLLIAAAGPALHAGEVERHWQFPVGSVGPAPAGAYAFALGLDGASCGQCHVQIRESWQRSLHAQAFSPGLAGQLPAFASDEQKDCLRCHAPRAEQQSEWFARTLSAALGGVDCAACHVRHGVRTGAKALDATPHGRVEARPLFKRSEFCAACHQFGPEGLALNGKLLENTYEEWKASRYARDNVTCQSCHMPGGRHEFPGIHDLGMTRVGLAVRASRTREGILVVATNSGAGHHLPTYTTPLVRLQIASGARKREHVIRRELAWDANAGLREVRDTRLAAGESVLLALELTRGAAGNVSATVDPGYDYHARIFPDLLASLGGKLAPAGRAMLRSALIATRDRAYTLYRFRCDRWRGHDTDCVPRP